MKKHKKTEDMSTEEIYQEIDRLNRLSDRLLTAAMIIMGVAAVFQLVRSIVKLVR